MSEKLNNIKAIIFDMDGVILDSESISDITWRKAAEERGQTVNDEILNACRGSNKNDTIVTLQKYYGKAFDSEGFSKEQKDLWNHSLYAGAVNIAETVLYVKQHSVNCIPAALYMTAKLFPGLFTDGDALGFLDSMFKAQTDIQPGDRQEIIQYMKGLFVQFQQESAACQDWKEPVKKWLINYEKRADNSKYGRPE